MENSANLSYPKSCSWVIMLSSKRSSGLLLFPPLPCTSHCISLHFTYHFYHSGDQHWIFLGSPSVSPHFPCAEKCSIFSDTCHLPAPFGSPGAHWTTHIPPQATGLLLLLMARLWEELPLISTLIFIRSPRPKERFWNRNCPQTPPQWMKEQKSLAGWSGLLAAWFGFVPQSSP